jgi:hypothetical protein
MPHSHPRYADQTSYPGEEPQIAGWTLTGKVALVCLEYVSSGDGGRVVLSDCIGGRVDEAGVVVEVDLTPRLQPHFGLGRADRGVELFGEGWGEGVF